jgi:hypothetical protein
VELSAERADGVWSGKSPFFAPVSRQHAAVLTSFPSPETLCRRGPKHRQSRPHLGVRGITMKALFLGHFAATVAPRILAKLKTPLETDILDDESNAAHLAPLLADAEIVVGHIWRAGFPPAPKLRLLQSVAAGLDLLDTGAVTIGTQDYICLPSGWTFFGPQATLFNERDEQIITHFLSPNPFEPGTPPRATRHLRGTPGSRAAPEGRRECWGARVAVWHYRRGPVVAATP